MMKNSHLRRLLALCMAVVMVMGLGVTGVQAADSAAVTYEKLDNINTSLINSTAQVEEETAGLYADTDVVRVTITMEQTPALELFGGIPTGTQISAYRQDLEQKQNELAAAISQQVLGGQELDVVWNLTLVTNAMSANVEFGKIEAIAAMDGVASVKVETRYMPMEAEPSNIVSQEMTGANSVQDVGYTGAGTRIAIIDTGTDTNHQSFAESGYLYALEQNAAEAGMTTEAYMESLDLLTVEEIAEVLPELNVSELLDVTAEELYISAKLPFGFNYVDVNLDVTHDNDSQGSHGSHVAGIAAANDYIASENYYDLNGDGLFNADDAVAILDYVVKGEFLDNMTHADFNGDGVVTDYDAHLLLNILDEEAFFAADEAVGVSGTAPDAQIITMKVFGASGGAYTSDYMAAAEDAVLLGCDVINLSLGSPYEGFATTFDDEYEAIMDAVAAAGVVMTVSAGNSGEWADTDDAYQLMYADESGVATVTVPSTLTDAFSIASANNVAVVSNLSSVFTGTDGESVVCDFYHPTDVVLDDWKTLAMDIGGTPYDVVFLGDPTGLMTGTVQTDSRIYAGSVEDFAGYDFTGKVVLVSRGTYNFGVKHNNAALAGAAAVVIYNNVPGTLGVLVEGTEATIPCASISLEEAQALYAIFDKNEDGLYAGTLTVTSGVTVETVSETVSMSSFSSWGTTGALTIKPEITAPGGSIYSVNGVDPSGTAYELMSGTSMSSPHVAGLSALAAQYIAEEGLEASTGLSARQLIQSLLMSTAEPVIEQASGVEYSVRNQGSGLANIANAVNAESYILVEGQPDGKVKAELGDGVDGWSFTFTIHNISGREMTYALDASILTTGTTEIDGYALTTSEMVELDADVTYSTGDTVTVPANGSASVTVTVKVADEAAAEMYELGNTNGFYVEGFLYAVPVESDGAVVGVTHSIPMLGWYGDWSDPSMYDVGSLYDMVYGTQEKPSHIASYGKNFVAMGLAGYDSAFYYTGNIYGSFDAETGAVDGDSRYIEARNALNLTDERQIELYAIFPSLIRNASDFKIEVRNADTGEVYFVDEYAEYVLYGSFYYSYYGMLYDMTMETGIGVENWDYTDANGDPIPEGTDLTFAVVCATEYYTAQNGYENWDNIGEGAELSYTFTVDNTAPELADIENNLVIRGSKLYYTVQDNNYVAAVILMNGTATEIVGYSYPDMDEEQRGLHTTGSLDLAGYAQKYGNKAVIAVCDYAGNESYYAVNLNGEGESYGDLVAFQYDASLFGTGYNSWVSFSEGVNANETGMYVTDMGFVNAEYVNGYVYAQTEDGKLYGIPYADMVANTVDLETTFVAQLENVYQDLAYSYVEGKLFGLYTYEYDGYPTSEIHSINVKGEYYDEDLWSNVAPYQEDWFAQRGGLYGLTMTIDDAGTIYILGSNYDWDTEGLTETAHLWAAPRVVEETRWGTYVDYIFEDRGDTGMAMDYLQSMTWDHNTGTLYWARFYPVSWLSHDCQLVTVDPENAQCQVVGTLSGETCAMFAPLTAETAAKELYQNVPEMDTSVVATPVLGSSNATMSIYSSTTLSLSFDPWYSEYKDVVWSSSDENVVTVNQNGTVTAVGEGSAVVTVANTMDETKYDTCAIEVTALDLRLEGVISAQGTGIGNVSGTSIYEFTMTKGIAAMSGKAKITASEELNFGLSLGTSELARGSIWAVEYANTGMIYEIDSTTGEVKDVLMPMDGDILFGLTYSEDQDTFAAIMNMYLYVDLELTHEEEEVMMESYDEELYQFMYHKVDMLPYLIESNTGFVTGEDGQGASSEIVFSGITTLEQSYYFEDTYKDYMGNWSYDGNMVSYTSSQTLVLMDNVGRLWYIDEIPNLTRTVDEYGNAVYTNEAGTAYITSYGQFRNGVFELDNGDGTYNLFNIRKIDETPLTDMFRDGTMPRMTYHFSDIELAGYTADGAPMFAISLYDYWNNGTTNELYLYIPGVGTGEWAMDEETWQSYEIMTPSRFYSLGNTGEYNIIASIHYAEVTGGVDTDEPEPAAVNALAAPLYTE